MKRITIFIPTLNGGGAEKMMVHLANEFARNGYQVDLLVGNAKGVYLKMVDKRVSIIDFKCSRMYKTLPKLISYLIVSKSDVLLSALNHTNLISLIAKKILRGRTKHIVSIHSVTSNIPMKKSVKYLFTKLNRNADGIIAISNAVKEDLIQNYSLNPHSIEVIYNPVITDVINEQIDLKCTNEELKIPEGTKLLMSAGRLSPVKDYPTLIKAFYEASKERSLKLLIFGEGPQKSEINELIEYYNLNGSVILMGFEKNIMSYYKYADLFILPSRSEGFGNVIIEAMGAGVNVICAKDSGSPEELLNNEEFGFLFEKSNAESLSKVILYGLDNNKDQTMLQEYSSHFHVKNIAQHYLKFFTKRKM